MIVKSRVIKPAALLAVLALMPILSGCQGDSSQAKSLKTLMASTKEAQAASAFRKYDWVKVSNAQGEEVAQITNRPDVVYVSDIVGDAANVDQVGLGKKYLSHAHPHYHYTFYGAKSKVAIHMTTYSDTQHVQVTNLPIIHAVHYKLSPISYQKLNHPFKYLKAVKVTP